MSITSLTNPGLIPMEAVTTMGVSAKEGESPIGFFGTGLKYAVAALPGGGNGVYYRKVLVGRLPKASRFTYNLVGQLTLTEDRTLRSAYEAESWIAYTLANCTDKDLLTCALTNVEGYEGALSYASVNETFGETVLGLTETKGITAIATSAVKAAETWAQREARVRPVPLSKAEADEIEAAKAFLARIGFPVTAPIVVADTLGPDVFGLAKNETIFLARITLNRGGNFLIGTILEEHLHLSQGFADESRRFQDFLIDLVVKFAREADTRPSVREAA